MKMRLRPKAGFAIICTKQIILTEFIDLENEE